MKIDEIRIYAECLEQGLDFKEYLIDTNLPIKNIYLPKLRGEINSADSQLLKILKLKSFDLALSVIVGNSEIPILLVEYSTAVPTDDHKMQRSDVYFWAGVFRIPVMKISPSNKGSFSRHGGGEKISNEDEIAIALKNNAVVYLVDFPNENNVLKTQKHRLSCVKKSKEINVILSMLIGQILKQNCFDLVYANLLDLIKQTNKRDTKAIKEIFSDSTRFKKEGNNIVVKINRFGHAMDPDRGILFFINMLFGNVHTITRFNIERQSWHGKESYDGLFDTFSTAKINKIRSLISQGVSTTTALEIFIIATDIDVKLKRIRGTRFQIQDDEFLHFLKSYTNNVYKAIFLNSKELRLYNLDDKIVCKISWNPTVVSQYRTSLQSNSHKKPIQVVSLDSNSAKEDIVTFASVEIFKKIGCEVLSVSYPGAQGDRAILIGSGRSVKRIYVDVIASQTKQNKLYVFLHENKDTKDKLEADVQKLQNIKANYVDEMNILLHKFDRPSLEALFLGLGSKHSDAKISKIDIDYIFTFNIESNATNTAIYFSVEIINLDLLDFFAPLKNSENKLQGTIVLDVVYTMCECKAHCEPKKTCEDY